MDNQIEYLLAERRNNYFGLVAKLTTLARSEEKDFSKYQRIINEYVANKDTNLSLYYVESSLKFSINNSNSRGNRKSLKVLTELLKKVTSLEMEFTLPDKAPLNWFEKWQLKQKVQ